MTPYMSSRRDEDGHCGVEVGATTRGHVADPPITDFSGLVEGVRCAGPGEMPGDTVGLWSLAQGGGATRGVLFTPGYHPLGGGVGTWGSSCPRGVSHRGTLCHRQLSMSLWM